MHRRFLEIIDLEVIRLDAYLTEKKMLRFFFLHSHSTEEAKEKWERRVKRINWNRLLIKFNDQNGCMEKEVNQFMNLNYKNKVFFTCKH